MEPYVYQHTFDRHKYFIDTSYILNGEPKYNEKIIF